MRRALANRASLCTTRAGTVLLYFCFYVMLCMFFPTFNLVLCLYRAANSTALSRSSCSRAATSRKATAWAARAFTASSSRSALFFVLRFRFRFVSDLFHAHTGRKFQTEAYRSGSAVHGQQRQGHQRIAVLHHNRTHALVCFCPVSAFCIIII